MNSTQTEEPKKVRVNMTGRVWLSVLEQDEWWIPRGAWNAYADASMRGFPYFTVEPDFTVDGVVAVADMDVSWRQSVMNFMWRKTAGICSQLASPWFFGSGSPYTADWEETRERRWMALARDAVQRRAWFDELPLIVRLRSTIIADRQRGPVLLGEVPGDEEPKPELIVVTRA